MKSPNPSLKCLPSNSLKSRTANIYLPIPSPLTATYQQGKYNEQKSPRESVKFSPLHRKRWKSKC